MAQTSYTPIQLYYSSTTTNVPLAANLASGELAINTYDGKLFYKDSSGVVQTLATKASASNSFSAGTTGLTPNTATTGAVTLAGTLATANGGTGVTTSSGANSNVLRDANANITTNFAFLGYSNVAAAGTTTTLTASSTPNWTVTGSGGQTYKLPDATTLSAGATYTFNNNQSSGTIVVQNNSSTTVVTVQSGSFVTVTLLVNGTAAGSWDYHAGIPSGTFWSTNTLSTGAAITSSQGVTGNTLISTVATGTAPLTVTSTTQVANLNAATSGIATNISGGAAGSIPYNTASSTTTYLGIGTNGYVLTSSGTAPQWTALSGVAVSSISFGSTGLTPSTATSGAVTVAGTLALASGGTGATTVAAAQTNLQVDPAGTAIAMAIALG